MHIYWIEVYIGDTIKIVNHEQIIDKMKQNFFLECFEVIIASQKHDCECMTKLCCGRMWIMTGFIEQVYLKDKIYNSICLKSGS